MQRAAANAIRAVRRPHPHDVGQAPRDLARGGQDRCVRVRMDVRPSAPLRRDSRALRRSGTRCLARSGPVAPRSTRSRATRSVPGWLGRAGRAVAGDHTTSGRMPRDRHGLPSPGDPREHDRDRRHLVQRPPRTRPRDRLEPTRGRGLRAGDRRSKGSIGSIRRRHRLPPLPVDPGLDDVSGPALPTAGRALRAKAAPTAAPAGLHRRRR